MPPELGSSWRAAAGAWNARVAIADTLAPGRWDELARAAEAEEAAVRAGWGEAGPQTQQAVVEELMGGLDEDREAMVNEEAEARKAARRV